MPVRPQPGIDGMIGSTQQYMPECDPPGHPVASGARDVVAQQKKPTNRSTASGGSSSHDDPRFIAVARGTSASRDIAIPGPDPKWKPKARSWFNSLKLSGQSEFFEASDWATAVAAADAYDVFLKTYNASIFAQFVRLSERLGATVSDRKRSRIELGEPDPTDEDEEAADQAVTGWHGRLYAVDGGLSERA